MATLRLSLDLPLKLVGAAAVSAFRDEALALPDDHVEELSADPAVVMANVGAGVDAVRPGLAAVIEARPRTNAAWILSLPNLGRAVEHAASATAPQGITRALIEAKYAELQRYRVPALLVARALSCEVFGAVAPDAVADIEAGQNRYEHGRGSVALASLFLRNMVALDGMHPFTDAQLRNMEALGAWITEHVDPDGSFPKRRSATGALDLRDRLWTLLTHRYLELRRAGIELYGAGQVDRYVPRLGSVSSPASPVNLGGFNLDMWSAPAND